MRKGFLMLAASVLFSLTSVAQTLETLDVSKEPDGFFSQTIKEFRVEGQVKNGKKDGVWYEYYAEKNMLHRLVQYQKGVMNGVSIEVSETGSLLKKMEYENDKLDGISYNWSVDGRLLSKNCYKRGEYDGEQVICYDNGQNQEVSYYKDGKRQGETVWFNRDGAKRMLINYKDGEFDGKQETYYPNGNLKSVKMFKNNVQDGEASEYYESGDVKSMATFKKGVLSGKEKTFPDKHPFAGEKKDVVKEKDAKVKSVTSPVKPDASKKTVIKNEKQTKEMDSSKRLKKG